MPLPPFITLEEHFFFQADRTSKSKETIGAGFFESRGSFARLPELGPVRLGSMDSNNIAHQVISHLPIHITPEQCRETNDHLAAAVKANPTRFSGFATLPVAHPSDIAAELRRCVSDLGFVGALVGNHANGTYYDGPEYDPMWETLQELDVPLYLHPVGPPETIYQALYRGERLWPGASLGIASFAWGWHADVTTHVLRLFAAGIFDKFPRLKLIAGHFGENLPLWRDRFDWSKSLGVFQGVKKSFREVYDENIWITTSGVWSIDPMAMILKNTKIDRILYSVDYPFNTNEEGMEFMEQLQKSGMVDEEQFAMIAYKNAENLLGIRAK